MALLFREVSQGRVKVSLRSIGDVDVAAFASGGEVVATPGGWSGPGGSLAEVHSTVLRRRDRSGSNGAAQSGDG
jgi:hypothetical protein